MSPHIRVTCFHTDFSKDDNTTDIGVDAILTYGLVIVSNIIIKISDNFLKYARECPLSY